ncbi:MAG: 6,7-dimethyl-8-ribityllumazine synthase [Bacteroidota bacterium]
MASDLHNDYIYAGDEDHGADRIAIVVAKWHPEITGKLHDDCVAQLNQYAVERIERFDAPGSYELPYIANLLASENLYDAIIVFGVVIQGETKHDDYINHAIAQRLMDVSMKHQIPVVLGVLTVNTLEQAIERSGGTRGHKGRECAIAALELIDLTREIKESYTSPR